jgi:hypothetical protein
MYFKILRTIFDDYKETSDHGYDYLNPSMHAIFFARGPNIRPRHRIPPFQAIEYFNMFVDLLRLPHEVPNNGTLGVLDTALANIDLKLGRLLLSGAAQTMMPPLMLRPLPECAPRMPFQKREVKLCANNLTMAEKSGNSSTMAHCQRKLDSINQMLQKCEAQAIQQPQSVFHSEASNLCVINLCSVIVVVDGTMAFPEHQQKQQHFHSASSLPAVPTMVYEVLNSAAPFEGDEEKGPKESSPTKNHEEECHMMDLRYDVGCDLLLGRLNSSKTTTTTLMMPNETIISKNIAADDQNGSFFFYFILLKVI